MTTMRPLLGALITSRFFRKPLRPSVGRAQRELGRSDACRGLSLAVKINIPSEASSSGATRCQLEPLLLQ
jgi:hypothetical protein